MMTRADELWLAMTFWVVRIVHCSSNSQCVSHSAAFCQTQLGTNSDLGLSLDTSTCIVHKQTNKDCTFCATINSDRSATSSVWHKQGEKQPRRRDASPTRRNNLVNVGKYTNLITLLDLCVSSQHFPNTVTRLSHNSIGHAVVGFISTRTKEKKKKWCFCNGFFFEEQVKQRNQWKKETIGK